MNLSTEDFWARLVSLRWMGRQASIPSVAYAASVAVVAAAAAAAWISVHWLAFQHVQGLFLAAVLLNAVLWGRGPSLLSVALTAAIVDFFFTQPLYSFYIANVEDVEEVIVLSILAILCGDLAAYVRQSALRSEQLYGFSSRLAGIADPHEVFRAVIEGVHGTLKKPVALLLPSGPHLSVAAATNSDCPFSALDLASADRIWQEHGTARSIDERLVSGWHLRSLRSLDANLGLIAIRHEGHASFKAVDRHYLESVLAQGAVAIERIRLAKAHEDARVQVKTENLRDALINSITHDLQTPLASILGSATALQSYETLYTAEQRATLLATIHEEAERLDHIIGNIVDLSRIRAGDLSARLELVEISDVVSAARSRARKSLAEHQVAVAIPAGLPMLRLDLFLMEHAFVNLLQNAVKYAPKGSRIDVRAERRGDEVIINLSDAGVGIAAADRERIFDRFVRAGQTDGRPAGMGLGLTICRAFIQANGGRIDAFSPGPGKGATFRITLPVPVPDPSLASVVDDE